MSNQHTRWRVIGTDTERVTGVAPVCDLPAEHARIAADSAGAGFSNPGPDGLDVQDCCPGPHIECWGEADARRAAELLNAAGRTFVGDEAIELLTAEGIAAEHCS
jgi:hypothetical protein